MTPHPHPQPPSRVAPEALPGRQFMHRQDALDFLSNLIGAKVFGVWRGPAPEPGARDIRGEPVRQAFMLEFLVGANQVRGYTIAAWELRKPRGWNFLRARFVDTPPPVSFATVRNAVRALWAVIDSNPARPSHMDLRRAEYHRAVVTRSLLSAEEPRRGA